MGDVGQHWDEALFRRFHWAVRQQRRVRHRLQAELLRMHEPLVLTIVGQLCGRPVKAHHARKMRTASGRVWGAWDLEWDVAVNAGRLACAKALDTFDSSRGSFSGYLRKKVYHELQNAVAWACVIKVGRVSRSNQPPPMAYVDSRPARQVDWLLGSAHQNLEAIEFAPRPIVKEAPVFDARSALDVFLEEHCRFVPPARTAISAARGRFRGIVDARGEALSFAELGRALRDRGVRRVTMRAPWSDTPVDAFAGLGLHATAKCAALPRSTGSAERPLSSGHGG